MIHHRDEARNKHLSGCPGPEVRSWTPATSIKRFSDVIETASTGTSSLGTGRAIIITCPSKPGQEGFARITGL